VARLESGVSSSSSLPLLLSAALGFEALAGIDGAVGGGIAQLR
jgi:hypothetical protein